jgi:hypothetical protein
MRVTESMIARCVVHQYRALLTNNFYRPFLYFVVGYRSERSTRRTGLEHCNSEHHGCARRRSAA